MPLRPRVPPDTEVAFSSLYSDTTTAEIIAHSPRWQPYFDKNLCYGVQYEIARLVTLGLFDYHDLCTDLLRELNGSNAEAAPKTAATLSKIFVTDKAETFIPAKEESTKSPWTELDTELEALSKNEFAGLGFSDEKPDWYGGKVEFRAKVRDVGTTNAPQYKIVLEKPVLGTSCRFTRRFGSHSFLRVKIPAALLDNREHELIQVFCRPFILTGRVFRAFYAKKDHVFLFKTGEVFDGSKVSVRKGTWKSGMTLRDFLDWHNPLFCNCRQSMRKWAARFALGLSTTVPGIPLTLADVRAEPDQISPTGSDMTDGCAYMNKAGLLRLQAHFRWRSFPTAVQCRLAGTKGLLSLHPDVDSSAQDQPTVWVRPSQVKIKYPDYTDLDPAMLVIDIVQASHMKPGRLKAETVINLAENDVPNNILVQLLQNGLDEHIAGLIQWEGPEAMLELWCNLAHKGGVMAARRARDASGEARARGYRYADNEDEDDDENGVWETAELKELAAKWWLDEHNSIPSSFEETIMILLDSGFTPQTCAALRDKLNQVVIKNINDYMLKCSIDVPMSCTAMLIPDPFGVLAPGEIHVKSSAKNLKTPSGLVTDTVIGDVLLTRYPCKLPTDMQKFAAVEKSELRMFIDVIVCSVQGDRRQADLLAGGDYDGDKGLAIWQPEIVDTFVPADLKYATEPSEVAKCFSQDNENVSDFLKRMKPETAANQLRALQEVLLADLRDSSVVGQYSNFHDNATYDLGYDHPETVRLAYMFCKVLDGSKTGLTVLPKLHKMDSKYWRLRTPYWKKPAEEKAKIPEAEVEKLCRRKKPFIMDTISREAPKAGKRKLEEVATFFSLSNGGLCDSDLTKPWLNAVKLAERYLAEENCDRWQLDLKKIADHVEAVYAQYQSLRQKEDTPLPVAREKIWLLSREFALRPSTDQLLMDRRDISRLKASYAYLYDAEKAEGGWSHFPWDMAMRELCCIKANALGSSKTITMNFYEQFSVKRYRR